MKIEYDQTWVLPYIYFAGLDEKAAKTVTVVPGVHSDLTSDGKLLGIEVIDASELLGDRVQFEMALTGCYVRARPLEARRQPGAVGDPWGLST